MGLKRCASCGKILTTEAFNKGFDYCSSCYGKSGKTYGKTWGSLKRCASCGEILTTEEYKKGYDYHLDCYLAIKGKRRW